MFKKLFPVLISLLFLVSICEKVGGNELQKTVQSSLLEQFEPANAQDLSTTVSLPREKNDRDIAKSLIFFVSLPIDAFLLLILAVPLLTVRVLSHLRHAFTFFAVTLVSAFTFFAVTLVSYIPEKILSSYVTLAKALALRILNVPLLTVHISSRAHHAFTSSTVTLISYIPDRIFSSYVAIAEDFVEGSENWQKVLTWNFPFLAPFIPFYERFVLTFPDISNVAQAIAGIPVIGIIFTIFLTIPLMLFNLLPFLLRILGGIINVLS